MQDPALDGAQHPVDIAVEAVGLIGFCRAAGGEAQQRPLAAKLAALVDMALTVDPPHGKDPIHPPLENSGQAKPPERELEDQQVGRLQLLHFLLQLRGETALLGGSQLFELQLEKIGIAGGSEVAPIRDGIKAHGIEIAGHHCVTRLLQRPDGVTEEGTVETFGFGMGMDDKHLHNRLRGK